MTELLETGVRDKVKSREQMQFAGVEEGKAWVGHGHIYNRIRLTLRRSYLIMK